MLAAITLHAGRARRWSARASSADAPRAASTSTTPSPRRLAPLGQVRGPPPVARRSSCPSVAPARPGDPGARNSTWARPTTARRPRARRRACPTTRWPRASAPASTARCSSPSTSRSRPRTTRSARRPRAAAEGRRTSRRRNSSRAVRGRAAGAAADATAQSRRRAGRGPDKQQAARLRPPPTRACRTLRTAMQKAPDVNSVSQPLSTTRRRPPSTACISDHAPSADHDRGPRQRPARQRDPGGHQGPVHDGLRRRPDGRLHRPGDADQRHAAADASGSSCCSRSSCSRWPSARCSCR